MDSVFELIAVFFLFQPHHQRRTLLELGFQVLIATLQLRHLLRQLSAFQFAVIVGLRRLSHTLLEAFDFGALLPVLPETAQSHARRLSDSS